MSRSMKRRRLSKTISSTSIPCSAARTQAERAEIYKTIGDQFNDEVPWGSLWSLADTNIFNRRVNIPFLQPPAGANPKTAAEVRVSTVRALFTWFYRIEEWGVRA